MNQNEKNALIAEIATRRGACFGTTEQKIAYGAGRKDAQDEIIEIIQRNTGNTSNTGNAPEACSAMVLAASVLALAMGPQFMYPPFMPLMKPPEESKEETKDAQCAESSEVQQGVSLSPPWAVYREKLAKLFELDGKVTVGPVVDIPGGKAIHIRTEDHGKADALYAFLNKSVRFGSVSMNIVVHDDSKYNALVVVGGIEGRIKAAFAGNRLVRRVETVTDSRGFEHTWLVMEPAVVQFWADNLADVHGNLTLTAEQLARDVLDIPGVAICTADLRENGADDGGAEN